MMNWRWNSVGLVSSVARWAASEGVRIYTYHGVAERLKDPLLERNVVPLPLFRAQIRFLSRFGFMSLGELAEQGISGLGARRPVSVITFDDGYVNNLQAAEILDHYRAPWTVFIPTGSVGRRRTIWPVELSLLLLHGHAREIELFDRSWPLTTREERVKARRIIRLEMKATPADVRRAKMHWLRQQFPAGETERLLEEFPSLELMSWEQIEQLDRAKVEIGSHGVDHEIHHENQGPEVLRHELVDSKATLEARLKRPCRTFAFPNGNTNSTSAEEVQRAGYRLGVTTDPGVVVNGVNPFLLPRLIASMRPGLMAWEFFTGTRRKPKNGWASACLAGLGCKLYRLAGQPPVEELAEIAML
jgi:peptidoglycan/xylan/chitin deacetylase (PgdA/CDA1 family)